MRRLLRLSTSTDKGYVYVIRKGEAYKIGFTRSGLARRVHDSGGELILAIGTEQRPSALEYAINDRFASKRLPPQGNKPGDKREWFALTHEDVNWLTSFAIYLHSLPKSPFTCHIQQLW